MRQLVSLIAALVLSQAQSITPEQAQKHVGEKVTVEGVVMQVTHTSKSNTTFANFCAPYPNHCFAAVVFSASQPSFPDALSWKGRKVRVSGVVRLYQGKPEVVLEKKNQLILLPMDSQDGGAR